MQRFKIHKRSTILDSFARTILIQSELLESQCSRAFVERKERLINGE